LSAILNRLDNENTVSIGILTSSEQSGESVNSFNILGFFIESCLCVFDILGTLTESCFCVFGLVGITSGFWALKPEEMAKSNIIEICLIIRCKYREYERPCQIEGLILYFYATKTQRRQGAPRIYILNCNNLV